MAFKSSQQKLAHNVFEQGDSGHLQLLKVNMEPSKMTQGKKRRVLDEMLLDVLYAWILTMVLLQFLHRNIVRSVS